MKKTTHFILFLLFFSNALSVLYAQTPSDENFDDNTTFDVTSNDFTLDGVRYQISGDGITYRHITSNSTFNLSEGGANDYALQFDINSNGGISSITISASDGSAFQIAGMSMDILSSASVQFTSDNGGSFNLNPNDGAYVLYQNYDFTAQSGFDNITTLTISGLNMVVDIDDLNFEPAVSPATAPTVTTSAASSITATGATLNGDVTSDGGATVTTRGFVYSSSDNTPNIGETGITQVTDGSGTGVFSEAISGLNSSTTYYYQAYATNSAGTTYGGVESFTTSAPQLVNFSWSADNLSAGATGVTYTFSYEIVTADPYNILYAINNNGWELPFLGLSGNNYEITPIEKENVTVKVNGSDRDFNVRNWSSGLLIVRLTDPTVASGSHVEIIIENVTNKSVGTHNWTWIRTSTSGGQEIDGVVSPNPIVLSANTPTVSTAAATSITINGATVAGNVTSDGGATVSARGFVYSSTDNTPTIGETGVTQVTDGSGTGVFDEDISGLSSSTTYYYRAYATNSAGTTYGGIENFTTLVANTPPIVDANTGLMVSQGTTGNIDSGKLHFNDDETEDDAQLTATITTAVAHGILFLDVNLNNTLDLGEEELIVNSTFTQDDVNNERIRYTSTVANETSDSFVFKVTDSDGGELSNQTFNITINQIPTVTVNNGLTLDEGTTELIDSGKLNANDAESGGGSDITFTITSAVSHGILFIDSNPSTVFEAGDIELIENATFTLDDINNDKLRYTNTVGNQTTDSFEFKVSDPDGGELTNQTFTITINLLEAPTVTTATASGITATTATLGGNVTDNGGDTVTERGIVYSTTTEPTTADTKVQIGDGNGIFSDEIIGLTAGTTYYVRAYAINSEGTSYGSEENFTTSAPQLVNFSWSANNLNAGATGVTYTFEYTTVTDLGGTDAILYALNTANGWNTNTVTVGDITVLVNGTSRTVSGIFSVGGSGAFITLDNPIVAGGSEVIVTIANVANNVNSGTYNWNWIYSATSGGNQIDPAVSPDPIVLSANAPTVTTTAVTIFTTTTATLGGEVTSNGGAVVIERGIVYNTAGMPNIDDDTKVQIASGDGVFSDDITGLTEGTTYYVRAYATNSEGTSYGSEENFSTSTLGLEDDHLKNAVSLYPNPVNNLLYITNHIKVDKVSLFDVLGKRIDGIKIENQAINLSKIKTGIYLLKIETDRGNVVKRIVKE